LRKFLTVIGAIVALLAIAAIELRSELESPYYGARTSEVFVDIPRNSNSRQIADLLMGSGILYHRFPFLFYIRLKNLGRRIQAGEYRFAEPATPIQVAQRLVQGDISFRAITIPEGMTARETIELLAKNGLGDPGEMQQLLRRTDWIQDIDPKARSLEGYLFPETYRFGRKADSETVIKAMVNQFRIRIAKTTALHPVPSGWTVPRVVILASMVEKEVKQALEAPLVASVLVNRLEKGMPLACDATIIYAMKMEGIYEGRLGKADMAMESPYNTYIHTDLPPGPISNPGDSSLLAALNPARTSYYYYVSRNDGTHQFSSDYNAHLNAVNRFQKSAAGRKK
jgi:UPF0755 protein